MTHLIRGNYQDRKELVYFVKDGGDVPSMMKGHMQTVFSISAGQKPQ